jgi:hypothetical protein
MEIGEQDLPWAQFLALTAQRLLDLHDHVGLGEDLVATISAPASV